jgi:hypothetical protein
MVDNERKNVSFESISIDHEKQEYAVQLMSKRISMQQYYKIQDRLTTRLNNEQELVVKLNLYE